MSTGIDKLASELQKVIEEKDKNKKSPYDTEAEVVRVDSDIVWVKIPGGVDETPAQKTVNAKTGDKVQVRVSGGRAFLVGNGTNPPTDDTVANVAISDARDANQNAVAAGAAAAQAIESANTANEKAYEASVAAAQAQTDAGIAHTAANEAKADAAAANTAATQAKADAAAASTAAGEAKTAANEAKADAQAANTAATEAKADAARANTAANDSLSQLSIVEDVVGTLNWITTHATYKASADTEVHAGKWYFTKSGDTYNVVTNPTGNPSAKGYYEVDTIDEAVSNYVASHLALTNEGLYLTKDGNGYKILLANDGLKVYDPEGHLVSTFGESIIFDSARPQTIGNNNVYIKYYDKNNDGTPDSLAIKADEFLLSSGKTIQEELEGVENWFYSVAPTTSNPPASSWTTDKLKEQHLRDIYFDTTSGKSYRWAKEGTTYKWVEIEDVELAALAKDLHDNYPPRSEFTVAPDKIQSTVSAAQTAATNAANTATDNKLKSYSTTTQMNSAISQSAGEITASVSSTYETKNDATSKLNTAKGYTDSEITSAKAAIKVTTDEISTEVSKKVGSSEVISKINQSAETVKIQASKVEIDGTATFNAIKDEVENTANAAVDNIEVGGRNLARGTADMIKGSEAWSTGTWRDSGASNTYNYTVSDSPVASVSKGVLVTTKVANTRYGVCQDNCPMLSKKVTFSVWAKGTAGGTISLQSVWWSNIPSSTHNGKTVTATGEWQYITFTADLTNATVPNDKCSICYLYWKGVNVNDTCVFIAPKLEYGTKATDWSPAPEDVEAVAVQEEQYIYISKESGTSSVSGTTTWVTEVGDKQNTWTTKRPTYNSSYPVLFVAKQKKTVSGAVTCTTPIKDDTTTVIDGGHITTGTIDASKATITNIDGGNILTNSIGAGSIKVDEIEIGAAQIKSGTIDTARIPNLSADKINSGTLNIGRIPDGALNSKIEVGGRNLLGGTANAVVPVLSTGDANNSFGSVARYNSPASEYSLENYDEISKSMVITSSVTGNRGVGWYTHKGDVVAGETYTFSCRVKSSVAATVHTHTAWRNGSATGGYTGWTAGGNVSLTANEWTDYSYTFTPDTAAKLSWEFMVSLCFTGKTTGVTCRIAHAKFEKGNKATDWSLAPAELAATATTYITDIGNDGIRVHDSHTTNNSVVINSDGMEVFKGGTTSAYSVAKYGDTARIGKIAENSGNVRTTSDGMDLYVNTTKVGSLRQESNYSPEGQHAPITYNNALFLNAAEYFALTSDATPSYYEEKHPIMETDGKSVTFQIGTDTNVSYIYFEDTYVKNEGGGPSLFVENFEWDRTTHVTKVGAMTEDRTIWLGVGTGGVNHGVFSESVGEAGRWLVFFGESDHAYAGTHFNPQTTSTSTSTGFYLGLDRYRWRQLYSYSAPNVKSDRKDKDVVGNLDYAKEFIMSLKPIEFQWKGSDHKRIHMGFIAQDVAEVGKKLDKDLSVYEAHYKDRKDDDHYGGEEVDDDNLSWSMMYSELIAPMVKVIQDQEERITKLEAMVEQLLNK